jgi:hypothetical protein
MMLVRNAGDPDGPSRRWYCGSLRYLPQKVSAEQQKWLALLEENDEDLKPLTMNWSMALDKSSHAIPVLLKSSFLQSLLGTLETP